MPRAKTPDQILAEEVLSSLLIHQHDGALLRAAVEQLAATVAEIRTSVEDAVAAYDQTVAEARQLVSLLTPPVLTFRSGLLWRSGFRLPRNTTTAVQTSYPPLEAWRRRPLDTVALFLGQDISSRGWGAALNNYVLGGTTAEPLGKGTMRAHIDLGHTPVLAFPLVMPEFARRFDLLAGGEWDAQHDAIAQRIATIAGDALVMLRPGWECNEGFDSSLQDDKLGVGVPDTAEWQKYYRDGFRRTALIYKKRIKNCLVLWNHLADTRRAMKPYYPGDDAVDAVTMDCYDAGWVGTYVKDEAAWTKYGGGYNASTGRFQGPNGLVAFCREIKKPAGFDEWGVWNWKYLPTHDANNPFFVTRMFQLFTELADQGELLQEGYFHAGGKNPHAIYPDSTYNPLPRQAYLSCYTPPAEEP